MANLFTLLPAVLPLVKGIAEWIASKLTKKKKESNTVGAPAEKSKIGVVNKIVIEKVEVKTGDNCQVYITNHIYTTACREEIN